MHRIILFSETEILPTILQTLWLKALLFKAAYPLCFLSFFFGAAGCWINAELDDKERRQGIYRGEIFILDRLSSVQRLISFARDLVEKAFAPHDPERVHEVLDPWQLAAILGKLKPAFTHHPESWRLMTEVLDEVGCDLADTYCDVPKLRTAYPVGHLTKGIAYAFPPHRDTWYAAPRAQINWWMPIYPLAADNAMAFYPQYFDRPADNDSSRFDYYRRNAERLVAAKFVIDDPRSQPAAMALPEDEPQIRLLPNRGGMIVFSGSHLHRTVPNTTNRSRYSIDFRTVSRIDLVEGNGAPDMDVHCTGTALRDFRCAKDCAAVPEELAQRLDPAGPGDGDLVVFEPPKQS
jgi:hypothetical protein